MNEKIKQIALESNLLWGEYLPRYHGELEDIKKFAELIVRECLNQVDEFDRLTKAFLEQGIDPEIDVTKEVLHNFGIE